MSLQHYFMSSAAGSGLVTIGAPGSSALHEHAAYRAVLAQRLERNAIAAQVRARGIGGQKFDSATMDADEIARAVQWGRAIAAFEQEHGKGIRRDGKAIMRDAQAFANTYRVDGKNTGHGARMDNTVPMASQGLSYILPEVYEFQHNDLPCWDEQILPIWTGGDPAAEEVVWYEMDNIGVAAARSTYDVSTIPMVNGPIASDNKLKIVPAMVGMETNFMDKRRESFASSQGKPDFQIETMKRRACERSIAEFFDNLWFGGDKALGIDGLVNNPYVETIQITGAWANKTPLQLLDDLKTFAWSIYNASAGALKETKNVKIILPPTQYQLLMQPVTSAGSKSVLAYFEEFFSSRGVPKILENPRLAASNSYAYNGGPNLLDRDTALVIYEDGDKLANPKFVLTQRPEVPAPVRVTGVGDVTFFHARGGGMMLPDARRMKYITGL
ncbi:MAG TPA: major capsid family protein [Nannocystis sp.]